MISAERSKVPVNLIQRHVCRQTPLFIAWVGVCAAVWADKVRDHRDAVEGAVG